jgi:HEPN domain-containing protein
MQPEKVAEVRGWLGKANEDLRSARVDLEATPPILGDALFHCQQAVEKALKGFLTAHDRPFRKTHDIDVLAADCEAIDRRLAPLLLRARELTPYAWRFRYPGDPQEPTEAEAADAMARAAEVVHTVEQALPAPMRSA